MNTPFSTSFSSFGARPSIKTAMEAPKTVEEPGRQSVSLMESIIRSLDPSYDSYIKSPRKEHAPLPEEAEKWKKKMDEVQLLIQRAKSLDEILRGVGGKKTRRQVYDALIQSTDIFHRRENLFKTVQSLPPCFEKRDTMEKLYQLRDIDEGSWTGVALGPWPNDVLRMDRDTLRVLLIDKYHDQLAEERARKELDFHNLMLSAYLSAKSMTLNGVPKTAPSKTRKAPFKSKAVLRKAKPPSYRAKPKKHLISI